MKGKTTLNTTVYNSFEIKKDTNAKIARIIIAKKWGGSEREVTRVLDKVYKQWKSKHSDTRVEFTITAGGFVEFEWDKLITKNDIGDPLNPNPKIIQRLTAQAQTHLGNILQKNNYVKKFSEFSRYMTFGVDSYSTKLPKQIPKKPHIEFVFVVDLKTKKFYHTGKIYPTTGQTTGLIRNTDMESHFMKLGGKSVMILGCHDLTMFNPRARAHPKLTKFRKDIQDSFSKMTKSKKPDIILQHPHSAIKASTWRLGWGGVHKDLGKHDFWYASAGKYYETGKIPESRQKVFQISKSIDSIDFIFS